MSLLNLSVFCVVKISFLSIFSLVIPRGGAIYKMDKKTRQKLRKELGGNEGWMLNYNQLYHFEDEGIMHTLAFKSGFNTSPIFEISGIINF